MIFRVPEKRSRKVKLRPTGRTLGDRFETCLEIILAGSLQKPDLPQVGGTRAVNEHQIEHFRTDVCDVRDTCDASRFPALQGIV